MDSKILFLDIKHLSSRFAAAYAGQTAESGSVIKSAGISPALLSEELIAACGEKEILSKPSVSLKEIELSEQFDLVVTIGRETAAKCPLLSGIPAVVNWNLEEPSECDRISWMEFTKDLRVYVEDFFRHGSFNALLRQHICLENVIDSLHEGLLAHDLNRKVFLFNRGAEKITGVSRDKVLGRDCHDLFTPHLCGEQCTFCDNNGDFSCLKAKSYNAIFTGDDDLRKELEVVRTPLLDEEGKIRGVIATLSDVTRVHELEMKLGESESFRGIIGQDHKILAIFQLIKDLSSSDFPVVITGESGTGKELVAMAIHRESARRDNLFVPVNCGALPEGTLESELFGHVRGAFTGAIRDKKGRFELADKGTLFLDEIGELTPSMQVKLLRVLQEGVFEPVGSETQKKTDVRVICATNRNLKEMVSKGEFREDLYYRLAVVPIEIPPLRERRNDIPLLARHFLTKTSERLSRGEMMFSEKAISLLMNYSWPGNIRQLQNAIQFAMIKCKNSFILPEHLPPEIQNAPSVKQIQEREGPAKVGRKPKLTVADVENAMVRAGGNKAKAARILGVGRATLYNFLNSHDRVQEIS